MRQTGRRKMALTQLGLLGCVLAGVLILGACQSNLGIPRQEAVAGPQGPEEALSRRQPWLIPLPEQRLLMVASVWRPQTSAPYPLAVISHASAENSELRTEDPTLKYEALARWLTQHGFVVTLPLRPGHSRTGGPYLEDQGGCDDADYVKSGLATAATIEATVAYMSAQSFVKKGRAVVFGQSAGGWGAIALASRNPPGVRAVVNFAGGRGGRSNLQPNNNCAPERLISAASEFGKTARTPSLWIYTENDSFFGPAISKRMADAFRLAGGSAEYHLLPPFGEEGHVLVTSPTAVPIWRPIVEKFLNKAR